ncbi:undecaprenyl-phosphate glucose phosphotransferase [Filimonas effusa]|uniref:Undecaprenyl-phosphate glucose phosphotransferase n=1 Tax=Filimonas effusa TaxID=2508721 RepID=A0A4Q1D3H3_9BACT|nr:undecaprenyl-phosphate glucose phosphotransferase [Filimonas effusa]RXK81859.1 undecaprenyl-phosphate glucose phosphotransferase [Filimonas effusa]
MSSRFDYIVRISLLVLDFILLNGTLLVAFEIFDAYRLMLPGTRVNLFYITNLIWLSLTALLKMYNYRSAGRYSHLKNATLNAMLAFALFFGFYLVLVKQDDITIGFSLYFLIQFIAAIGCSRLALKAIIRSFVRNTRTRKKIAIIGFNDTARKLAEYFSGQKTSFEFSGFFDDDLIKHQAMAVPVTQGGTGSSPSSALAANIKGSVKDIIDYAITNNIKEIYSTLLPDHNQNVQDLVKQADQHFLRIKFVPDFTNMLRSNYHIDYMNHFPVISLRDEPLQEIHNQLIKRCFDIVFSTLVIVFILSWLYPLIALCIKLSSKGPVIFRQLRSGQDNKPFWCYKFRTMTVNSNADSQQALKGDVRVTRLGAFLRKTSLDELPQFLNVLLGDMSVIGPRPHMLMHTEQYSAIISKFMVRHFVKPGISGWAQINGLRGGTETNDLMEKRVEHDIWYMEHWSILLDMKIIFRTVFNIFKGEETAY